jgi:hypothetical protein
VGVAVKYAEAERAGRLRVHAKFNRAIAGQRERSGGTAAYLGGIVYAIETQAGRPGTAYQPALVCRPPVAVPCKLLAELSIMVSAPLTVAPGVPSSNSQWAIVPAFEVVAPKATASTATT